MTSALSAGDTPAGGFWLSGVVLLGGVALLESELFQVVFVFGVAWGRGFVEEGVAQRVGAFFPVWLGGPVAVFGDGEGAIFGCHVSFDAFYVLVVDEEVSAVVAGQGDFVLFVA